MSKDDKMARAWAVAHALAAVNAAMIDARRRGRQLDAGRPIAPDTARQGVRRA